MKKTQKEKDPLEFKPLIPLSIAAGLIILASIFFFVTPIGKTFTKKAIQRVSTTAVEDSPANPLPVQTTVIIKGKPLEEIPSSSPRLEKSASIVDRILDSLDRVIASSMGLIGLIVAAKQLKKGQTVKKARAAHNG